MSHRRPTADAPANPFCTRYIRPGAIPFHFADGETAAGLIGRFELAGWRGAIVGPHGSGKSTLLATLLPAFGHRGLHATPLVLHDGRRWLPRSFAAHAARAGPGEGPRPKTIVVVDGYEQLGFFSRCHLRWLCWRRRLGLLVTSHHPAGLPVLYRTKVSLAMAQRVVAELQEGFEAWIGPDDVAGLFPRCRGNLRELLFGLFDLYEARHRKGE